MFGVALVAVWLGVTASIVIIFDCWPTRGQVGDTFGAVNSLFSGLALVFSAYALVLQARELEAQRLERERERRKALLAAQPRLVGVGASYNEQSNEVTAENVGAGAGDITVRPHPDVEVALPSRVAPGASIRVTIRSRSKAALADVAFTIDYVDSNDKRATQRYFLPKNTHFLSLLE